MHRRNVNNKKKRRPKWTDHLEKKMTLPALQASLATMGCSSTISSPNLSRHVWIHRICSHYKVSCQSRCSNICHITTCTINPNSKQDNLMDKHLWLLVACKVLLANLHVIRANIKKRFRLILLQTNLARIIISNSHRWYHKILITHSRNTWINTRSGTC